MMEPDLKLSKAPIVEAVIDIDCDFLPAFNLAALELPCRDAFRSHYPKFRALFLDQHKIESKTDEPAKHSAKRAIQALQFLHDDEKQLVQMRAQGFSFNRLAPYTSLDDYLSEIHRTWELFMAIASPVQIRAIRLRYINRILLPFTEGHLDLADYFEVSPKLPNQNNLLFTGFLNQHTAVESETGHQLNIVLASQPPENNRLPVIFDICAASAAALEPRNWPSIQWAIESLGGLKNRIFRNTLTERCLKLFQP